MAKYNPKIGDVVIALGQNVTYQVLAEPDQGGETKVQPFHIGKQMRFGQIVSFPRSVLQRFKEDDSQSAVRIVREATE